MASILGTVAANSLLGMPYWWIAAKGFSLADVGLTAAAISAMILLGNIATVGLGTLLIGELPRHPGAESRLLVTALVPAAFFGLVLGLLFAVISPVVSPELALLSSTSGWTLVFLAGVSATAVSLVLDQGLIGLLRGELQFIRNLVFSVVKLAAVAGVVVLLASGPGLFLFGTWVGSAALSLLVPLWLLTRSSGLRAHLALDLGFIRRSVPAAAAHHGLNVSRLAPTWVMPLLVTALLSAQINAVFYIALLLAMFVYLVSGSATLSLYAVARRSHRELKSHARLTLGLSLLASALATIGALAVAHPVLALFGPSYEEIGATPLVVLIIGAIPIVIKDHWIAVHRIQGRIGRAGLILAVAGVAELAFAGVGSAYGGLLGLSVGWVLALFVEAVLMLPVVARLVLGDESLATPVPSGHAP